jgi:hypothetical protein
VGERDTDVQKNRLSFMKTHLFLTATGDRYQAMAKAAAKRWRKLLPELSGVTIAGDVDAILCGLGHYDPARRACALKLHAFELIPEDCDAVLYADLDVYPFCPISPSTALAGVDFACVRDRWDDGEVNRVSDSIGVPRHQYFNAGLFYARRNAAPMLAAARLFYDKLKWFDQTGFNLARFAHRTPTAWLPWRANVMDRHDLDYAHAATHAPHHAWPAWEANELRSFSPLPDPHAIIEDGDYSHPYATDPQHLHDLVNQAAGCRHILEVGTWQGHAAWPLAATGALVTTLDPIHQVSKRQYKGTLSLDAMAHTGAEWLAMDSDGVYDMIFHDAEHGPHIIPELEAWWGRLLPGGILAVHDAEQLEGWRGQTLPTKSVRVSIAPDARGRDLLMLRKI